MRYAIKAAQRVGDGVGITDVSPGKSGSGQKSGLLHFSASIQIGPIGISDMEILEDQLDGFLAVVPSFGGITPADIGLDGMGQCIHTSGGRNVGREFHSQ